MEASAKAIYLFCFVRPGFAATLSVPAVDGRSPVLFWHSTAATAVLSELPLAEFCGPAAEARMQDLAWVAPRACRHEQVIEALMPYSPVLPLPWGTLFSSLANLQRFAQSNALAISRFLDQVADQEEWAVKGFLAQDKARQSLRRLELVTHEERLAALSPGRRYLELQRLQREVDNTLSGWLQATCRTLLENLRGHSSGFAKRKILDTAETQDGCAPVLNWAFLLPRNAVESFRQQVELASEHHATEGLMLELSGPWPAYSFAPSLLSEARE